MKQRLSVRAIINDGGKALVLRRANGPMQMASPGTAGST